MLYCADFETDTLSDQEEHLLKTKQITLEQCSTKVWAYGLTEIGNTKEEHIQIGQSIDSFMTNALKLQNGSKIYFHNLKFDGHFILSWLLRNNYTMVEKRNNAPTKSFYTLISDMGMFYTITVVIKRYKKGVRKIEFLDSYKKLPFSIDQIAKSFNLDYKKLEVEESFYKLKRSPNHILTPLEKEYLLNDIRVLSQALLILEHEGMTKMTTASNALYNFKQSIGGDKAFRRIFPKLEIDLDHDIKKAYRGGVSMVKESVRGKTFEEGTVYDVNSMYPFIMKTKQLPYGHPLFYEGEYIQDNDYPLYIQELSCEFEIKPNHCPTLQIKDQLLKYKPSEYLTKSKGETRIHLTNVDLELFLSHYNVTNLTYTCGYKFKSRNDLFVSYIEYWGKIKETTSGAKRQLAKLMLNSLYGKFATKTSTRSKHAVLKNDVVNLELGETEFIDSIYSAVAVWVTAYGRELLLKTVQKNYNRFIYCDTDSIHLQGTEPVDLEVDPNKLGAWDKELTFTRGKFLGAKCYVEEYQKDQQLKLKVVCAGMTKEQHSQVTFENFKIGLVVHGKLQPKVVKGGVVLMRIDYEVKIRGFLN